MNGASSSGCHSPQWHDIGTVMEITEICIIGDRWVSEWVSSIGGITLKEENRSHRTDTCSSARWVARVWTPASAVRRQRLTARFVIVSELCSEVVTTRPELNLRQSIPLSSKSPHLVGCRSSTKASRRVSSYVRDSLVAPPLDRRSSVSTRVTKGPQLAAWHLRSQLGAVSQTLIT